MAGLAFFLCIAGCGGDAGSGPAPAAQDEEAALDDAAQMLDAREPVTQSTQPASTETPQP
ncbi:hypothetical protein GRF63_01420 [Erythrobacter sp. GH3-10]|uniref:Uncharacterized protein n=1 Tax=Aurantiacibacter rhizosphaerae TaxID=2691582 RepID=A0A844X9X8_9SPHN|nr:hypothetical protein [Aurantiacibacter rhizosphaerae]